MIKYDKYKICDTHEDEYETEELPIDLTKYAYSDLHKVPVAESPIDSDKEMVAELLVYLTKDNDDDLVDDKNNI
jgi:uncharacterized lipoprotein YehR (DUF1307 family)